MLLRRHPGPRLSPFVKILWATDQTALSESVAAVRERVLPTGGMHLVFRLSDHPLRLAFILSARGQFTDGEIDLLLLWISIWGAALWHRGAPVFSIRSEVIYSTRDGLPSEDVSCLLQDSAGVLWIGTAKGLAFLSSGHVQLSPEAAPLREQILGLAEDRNGSIWIATSNHVLRVSRDKLLNRALGEGDIREFGIADGLHGVEGVKRSRSVVADPLGRIWFSLNRGLSVVDPTRLAVSSAPAIVHLQTISADGRAVDLRGPVRIPAGYRHSGAKSIEVELEHAAKQLRILVRDNGCGIDPQVLQTGREGHWGLSGMRERAERIGARLKVLSRAAAGTEVELSVPSHIAFRHQSPSGRLGWLARIYPRKTRPGDPEAKRGN